MVKEGKYIHYCWFGGKPLPKLAKKCLDSWKKYFPDYEIKRWDENNSALEDCPFVKGAYEAKSYAFVADYIRAKVMCEMGGIYFDTDMEVIKDPKEVFCDSQSFLGVEDTGKVCCGVWYEKYANSFLATELLNRYRKFKGFDYDNRTEFTIPILLTDILEKCGFDYKKRRVQKLEHDITIYPREYFYPYSYNRTNNVFTDNTCMVHYYDASWLPMKNRIENYLVRKYGRVKAIKMIKAYQKINILARRIIKGVLFPVVLYRRYTKKKALFNEDYLKAFNSTIESLQEKKDVFYIALHNGAWFGVTSATRNLFDNCIDCRELYRKKDVKKVARAIVGTGAKQVIFSAMSKGGPELAVSLHKINPNIKIKVFWHGSMSQVLDEYGWGIHKQITQLYKRGVISAFATCKESLCEFYRGHGMDPYFISNTFLAEKEYKKTQRGSKTRIGIYAADSANWRKNVLTQIAAVSELPGKVVIDIVPITELTKTFAESLGLEVTGVCGNVPHDELIERISNNDVNVYVTYSECSPILPLESLEVGVPCITGNNHHYFVNSPLGEYLVVDNEIDLDLIAAKIKKCIKNRKEVMQLYSLFREENNDRAEKQLKEFLEV